MAIGKSVYGLFYAFKVDKLIRTFSLGFRVTEKLKVPIDSVHQGTQQGVMQAYDRIMSERVRCVTQTGRRQADRRDQYSLGRLRARSSSTCNDRLESALSTEVELVLCLMFVLYLSHQDCSPKHVQELLDLNRGFSFVIRIVQTAELREGSHGLPSHRRTRITLGKSGHFLDQIP